MANEAPTINMQKTGDNFAPVQSFGDMMKASVKPILIGTGVAALVIFGWTWWRRKKDAEEISDYEPDEYAKAIKALKKKGLL